MELKFYLRKIYQNWWIVLIAFILTLIPTIILVNQQPWIYESTTTFVIRPRTNFAVNDEEVVKALDTISRRVEINTTFAEVSSSRIVKDRAIERLELSSQERKGLTVNGRVVAGTNIMEIRVQGPNPLIVRDYADAVSLETMAYVANLYDVFELEQLDKASLPSNPVSPNKLLNIAVGGGLGLIMGLVLVFMVDYLKEPERMIEQVNIIDFETGAYNQSFFMLRLRQELSRARHNDYEFSLALIKIYQRGVMDGIAQSVPNNKALRLLIAGLGANLREEDILAYMGQNVFALLLPDLPIEAAEDVSNMLRAQISLISSDIFSNLESNVVYCSIGLVAYGHQYNSGNEMLTQATLVLQEADTALHGKVELFKPTSDVPTPFSGDLAVRNLSPDVSR